MSTRRKAWITERELRAIEDYIVKIRAIDGPVMPPEPHGYAEMRAALIKNQLDLSRYQSVSRVGAQEDKR